MHTVGQSERFCNICAQEICLLFDSFIPNLGMFVEFHFQILITNWQILLETTGPETAVDIIYRWISTLKSSHYPEIYKFHAYRWHSTFKCQCFCTVFWSSFSNFQRITLRLTKINICQKCLINYTKLAAKVESRNLCKWLNSPQTAKSPGPK